MTAFIEALKRLFTKDQVTDSKLLSLKDAGKITLEEYNYIKS